MVPQPTFSKDSVRRIYSSLLKQAPPGEYSVLFDDLRIMHPDEDLLLEQTHTTLIEFNHKNFEAVQHPDIRKTLLTKYNLIGTGNDGIETQYIEPNTNKVFTYDHVGKLITDVKDNHHKYDYEQVSWRAALQKELDHYINNHFQKHGVGAVFIYQNNIVLCIGSHKYQKRNCYNGRWASVWNIPAFSTERVAHSITGHIDVLTHYFEDGNVQMALKKDITLNVAYSTDLEAAAKMVMKSISEAENAYAVGIQEKFNQFSDQTFKALRRPLPITRAKMDWQKLHSYRLVKTMGNQPNA